MPLDTGQAAGDELVRWLAELDQGRYAMAIEAYENNAPPVTSALTDIWRAEVALYLDRLDDAAGYAANLESELAPHLRAASATGNLARRRQLICAEILYYQSDYLAARDLIRPITEYAENAGDAHAQIRAWLDLGRVSRRQGHDTLALRKLGIAAELARDYGNLWFDGVIELNEGLCLYRLNDVSAAERALTRALGLLRETENLRCAAVCANALGRALADLGREEEALAHITEAEKIAARLGIVSDALRGGVDAAWALTTLGRHTEAERKLVDLLGEARAGADAAAELASLKLLTLVQIGQGKPEEAERTAEEVTRLAESGGTETDAFDALLLAARARAHKEGAIEDLKALVARADQASSERHRLEARIYLAEALASVSPIEAKAAASDARALPALSAPGWLLTILERVEHDLSRAPIRFESEVTLVIDTSTAMPHLKQAREAVERFLYERAMSLTKGNASAAGRLLGASPFQMHCLGRVLRGEAPRPSRGDGETKRKYERRRSRKLHQ
jgi:tetratricopeptide (TPR) repeat protein